jgi:hypothetical protein
VPLAAAAADAGAGLRAAARRPSITRFGGFIWRR